MSSRAASREQVAAVITPIVTAAGYDLEDVAVTPAGRRSRIRVVVDADKGVTLDQVADLSRAVSAALDDDADAAMGAAPYVLEVSSPGVDRPLSQPRHWRRATGRLVIVTPVDGEPLRGRVVGNDEHGVVLDVEGQQHELRFDAIASGRVEVEFNRRAAGEEGS